MHSPIKKFFDSIGDLFGDNYELFFENPDVNGSGPWRVSDIVFGFTYMKLLDGALRYSKEKVLEEFENSASSESLMNCATYPTGETLGFYNTSKYDLEKLSESREDISTKINDYLKGFSDNVKEVFEALSFSDVLEFLDKTQMTFNVIKVFSENEIIGDNYSSFDKFIKIFSDFIRNIWHDEFYIIGRDPIATCDALSSYHYVHKALNEYDSFLNTLLLMERNFENNEDVKIYDPYSNGTYILDDTKDMVLMFKEISGHEGDVEIYGKSEKEENEIIYLSKKSVSKKDPYEIEDATVLDMSEDIFSVEGIDTYEDFNLIISNYLYNDYTEYKDIFKIFKKKSEKNTKMVIALNCLDDFIDDLAGIAENDNLESVISFKNHYIIIANLDKSDKRKGHYLLIDESDPQINDNKIDEENQQAFSNNDYNLFNAPKWKTLTKSDHEKMERILKSYQDFKEGVNCILIKNEDYDEEMIRILLN